METYKFKKADSFDDNIIVVRDEIIKFVKRFKTEEEATEAINEGHLSAIMYNNEVGDFFFNMASREVNKLLGHPKRKYIYDLQEIIDF